MSTIYRKLLYLLALSLSMSTSATGRPQTLPIMTAPRSEAHDEGLALLCQPDLIEATFTFASLPVGEQTVTLHFQNKGDTACRLRGMVGPNFNVNGHSIGVQSCWMCDRNGNLLPSSDWRPGILLAPGDRAALDLQWASTGETCQWADWANFSVPWSTGPSPYYQYLFVPSDWPMHICSAVRSAGYRTEAKSPPIEQNGSMALHISVAQAPIYSDERVILHGELSGWAPSVEQQAGCASLYTVRQGPSIWTRLDPLRTVGSSTRTSYTPEQIKEDKERAWPSWKRDHLRTCAIPGTQATADAEIRAADLADVRYVEWSTASSPGEGPVFVTTAAHFSVLDVDTLAPNWGDPVEGIRAGLSVEQGNL